jgi:transcriptional regulator
MAAHDKKQELVQGTLDMLILKTLAGGPMHGYAIARRIQQATSELLKVEEGSLYPALHRMERRGWIEAYWGLSETNRRAKYYGLTAAGRAQLKAEVTAWNRFVEAVAGVLGISPSEA